MENDRKAAVPGPAEAVERICDHQPLCGLTAFDDCPACVPHECDTHGGGEAFVCPELNGAIARCVDYPLPGSKKNRKKFSNALASGIHSVYSSSMVRKGTTQVTETGKGEIMASKTQRKEVASLVAQGADLQATTFWSTGAGASVAAGRENVACMRDDEAAEMIEELREQIRTTTTATRAGRVMCCSACGDHMPCTRTPMGWLCQDCSEQAAGERM